MNAVIFKGTVQEQLKEAVHIRVRVFMDEQGVSEEEEFDDLDHVSTYVLIKEDGKAVGCGRVYFKDDSAYLGRIAVLPDYRKSGVGKRIVTELLTIAASYHVKTCKLGAQLQAINFYKKLGFLPYGDEYLDAGIVHIHMQKSIC